MRVLILVLIGFIPICSSAAHLVGGQIEYTCLGSNNYNINVRIYRDCFSQGAPFDDSVSVAIFSGTHSNPVFLRQIFLKRSTPIQLSSQISNPCLEAPTNACTEYMDYSKATVLAPNPTGYILSHQRCCRNGTISNIPNPGTWGNTYTIDIPANDVACNSSPVFSNVPPVVLCNNNDINFDHSAVDPDGDSLYYELCSPLHGGSQGQPAPLPSSNPPFTQVPFLPPFSPILPLPANPQVSINPSTGLLSGYPSTIGQYVFAVCVLEYRNGLLLSRYRRDFQFNVVQCVTIVALEVTAQINLPTNTICNGLTVPFEQTNIGANSFTWYFGDPANPGASSASPAPVYTYSDTGTYLISLVINNGTPCSDSSVRVFQLNYPLNPEINVSGDFCSDTQQLLATAQGNFGPEAQFSWTIDGNAYSGNPVPIPPLASNGPHTVDLSVKDFRCSATIQSGFSLFNRPEIYSIVPEIEGCSPLLVSFSDSSSSETSIQHYWDFGDGTTSTLANPTHIYRIPGSFSIFHSIETDSGCIAQLSESFQNRIIVRPKPTAFFTIDKESTDIYKPYFEINDSSSSDVIERLISMGDGIEYSTSNPFIHYYQDTGTYVIQEWVRNSFGCTDTFSIAVRVRPPMRLYIPNTFTPNNDGKNDFFSIRGAGWTRYHLQVWNRWGEIVFQTTDAKKEWNGNMYNIGKECQSGVYTYSCVVIYEGGRDRQERGTLNLIR